jgi:YegS/Rv2252/BmrU family lipid kinase
MKVCLIVNPKSGLGTAEISLELSKDLLIKKGHKVTEYITLQKGDAKIFAERAVKDKFDLVIAVGGDGTINEVVNGLANSETALGVIPTGTANVFAKEIGIPTFRTYSSKSFLLATQLLLDSEIKKIDLGKVKLKRYPSRYFLMWCGVGLDASITSSKKSPGDFYFGKYINFFKWVKSGIITTIKFSSVQSEIRFDDHLISEKVNQIIVSNGKLYANYFKISKESKLDDGLFDVVIMKGNVFPGIFLKGLSTIVKKEIYTDIKNIHVKKISISSNAPLSVHVDAETIGETPVDIEIAPKALKVLMPK